ncbi:MAG: division/cell wall cluster transcriptional repressor MraZ [Bacteroidetes bacterium]|nr:division/cell wall cluster transcriptional repressor MraZ [Bacteroidota bacterium]
MASFKGTYEYVLDPKNRFNIPSKMRSAFVPEDNDSVVLTQGFDPCIYIYSMTEWKKLEEKFRGLSVMDSDMRKLIRIISGNAHEYELDKQGRVVIPQTLLHFAQIEKDILIIGMLNWIEVWNPKKYQEIHAGFDLQNAAGKIVSF